MNRCFQSITLLVLPLFLICLSINASPATQVKRVLLISSYHPGFPTFFQQTEGVRSVFARHDILLDVEFMDSKRFVDDESPRRFFETLRYKLEHLPPYDLVLSADDTALSFLLAHKSDLFGKQPAVFFGVNNIDIALAQNDNPEITGVVEAVSMRETLEMMRRLRPKAKIFTALVDGTDSGQGDLHNFFAQATFFPDYRFQALSLQNYSFAEYPAQLQKIDEDQAVLLLSAYVDRTGARKDFAASLETILPHLSQPLFHLWYHGLGQGLIGGKVISHFEQGRVAAEMALKIFAGTKIAEMSVVAESPNQVVFDYPVLQRFGLENHPLVATAQVLSQPYSFYRSYRNIIWATSAFIILQTVIILYLITNIRQRRRVEVQMRESEARYASLFTANHSVILLIDPSRLQIVDANPAACKYYGYSLTELKGKGITEINILPRQEIEEKAALAQTKEQQHFLLQHRLASGEIRDVEVYSGPLVLNGKKLLCSIVHDITERKQAAAERDKLQAQLQQAQKLEAIGSLAGGIAHDFNNMLGVILGHTELALLKIDNAAPLYINLQAIQHAAERSAALTRQLLAFARKQIVAPKVIDLNETVEGMLNMLHRLIGEDIDLLWQPGQSLQLVKVDPSQIDQLLVNLCVNARDAIAGEGKITIETASVIFDESYCAEHNNYLPGEYTLLGVSDDGCGINQGELNHIFEPFFTTKEQGKGTGLGLASVLGIVEQNNGFINVYSEPDQGTTFKIYIPAYVEKSADVVEKAPDIPAERGHETILLVEDEPAILHITTIMLTTLGYTVVAAATPGEAIRLAHEFRGSIDMLMTDVVMPEMNGRELAGNLLSRYPDLKRLFMSGYTADVIGHRGVLDEGVHFIQKPFSMKDLARKLREALAA